MVNFGLIFQKLVNVFKMFPKCKNLPCLVVLMCVVKDPTLNFERGSFKYHDKRTYVYLSGYLLKIGASTQLTTYPNLCHHLITVDEWVSKTQTLMVLYIFENSENPVWGGFLF
jgi:hypothetical protein